MSIKKFLFVDSDSFYSESSGAYETSDYISGTAGAGDANKPIKTNPSGLLDATFLPSVVVRTDQDSTLASGVTIAVNPATTFTANDLISKSYADAIAAGFGPKRSVRIATDANIDTFVYDNGTDGVGATLTAPTNNSSYNTMQSVLLSVGDRVLVKDQTDTFENGIYAVSALGNDSDTSFTLTRAIDFDNNPDGEIRPGDYTFVIEGTKADLGFVQIDFTTSDVVGTDPITFTEFMSPTVYVAGDGIDIAGTTISVDVTDFIDTTYGLTESSNDIRVNLDSAGGLGFDSINYGIEVVPDVTTGATVAPVTVGANGVGVTVDNSTIGHTSGTLGVKADGINDTHINWGTGANQVSAVDVPIADAGGYTTQTEVEGALQEIYGMLAESGAETFTVGAGGVTKGDLVYVSANDTVNKLDIDDSEYGIGLAMATIGAGSSVKVVQDDTILEGVLTGAIAGAKYYWSWDGSTGGITATAPTASGKSVWQIGIAKNATDLYVEIRFITKRS
jgi:hypothetical protein